MTIEKNTTSYAEKSEYEIGCNALIQRDPDNSIKYDQSRNISFDLRLALNSNEILDNQLICILKSYFLP